MITVMKTESILRILSSYLSETEYTPAEKRAKLGLTNLNLEKLIYYQSQYSGRRESDMTSETSTRNLPVLLVTVFYGVVGILQLGGFAISISSAPLNLPVLGILGLFTAYSIYATKKWAVPLAGAMLIIGFGFAASTLATSVTLADTMLLNVALVGYIILLALASLYMFAKRENF
jgi:hypothetical protein